MISILVPSYGRADKIKALVDNIRENTYVDHEILVIVERKGTEVPDYSMALKDEDYNYVKVLMNNRSANYAGAINMGAEQATFENIFCAADDVRFQKGWDTEALKVMDALPNIKVVGTNDLFNSFVLDGLHATHYLVSMEYIDLVGGVIDGDLGHVLFEGYDHNYTDTEFIGTAKARAVFAPCLTSVVEHVGWTTNEFQDETKSKTNGRIHEDSELYIARCPLWWGVSK